jgi:CRP-like cAMP-binding protein
MLYDKHCLDALQRHAMFSKLNDEERNLLLGNARQQSYPAQARIFDQDQPAQHFFFILSGNVRLFRIAPSGNEKVIEIMGPGDTFAEAVMFMDRSNYPVCAETTRKTELIMIRNADFHSILIKRPDICLKMLGALSARLHLRLNELEILSLQSAADRVIHYLVSKVPPEAGNGHEVTLEIPKRVLASRLSMLPETFSRVLHKLIDQNIIQVRSRKIRILDIEGLKSQHTGES